MSECWICPCWTYFAAMWSPDQQRIESLDDKPIDQAVRWYKRAQSSCLSRWLLLHSRIDRWALCRSSVQLRLVMNDFFLAGNGRCSWGGQWPANVSQHLSGHCEKQRQYWLLHRGVTPVLFLICCTCFWKSLDSEKLQLDSSVAAQHVC